MPGGALARLSCFELTQAQLAGLPDGPGPLGKPPGLPFGGGGFAPGGIQAGHEPEGLRLQPYQPVAICSGRDITTEARIFRAAPLTAAQTVGPPATKLARGVSTTR